MGEHLYNKTQKIPKEVKRPLMGVLIGPIEWNTPHEHVVGMHGQVRKKTKSPWDAVIVKEDKSHCIKAVVKQSYREKRRIRNLIAKHSRSGNR